jgi:hypothetical protein
MKAADLLICASLFWLYGLAQTFALDQSASACFAASAAIRKIPPEIERHLQDWMTIANFDRVLQVGLALSGMVSALVVSTFTDEMGPRKTKIFSFIAALSFGVLSGFDIGGKADRTRDAWRHLTTAVLKFKNDPYYTYDKLIEAYSEGEALVGNVPFNRQSPVSNASGLPPDVGSKHE